MGRYLGKCKGVMGEVAVVGSSAGVRTRARAALMAAETTTTDRRSSGEDFPAGKKIKRETTSFNVYELRSGRRRSIVVSPEIENSGANLRPETTSSSDVLAASSDVSADFAASCCSSNIATSSSDVVKDDRQKQKIVADPEVESAQTSSRQFSDCSSKENNNHRVTKSDDLDSPSKCSDAKSTVQIKMPSDSEIEDFFAAAEKDLHQRFSDKYNFDIVKDVPLEGRYEWVQIKQ